VWAGRIDTIVVTVEVFKGLWLDPGLAAKDRAGRLQAFVVDGEATTVSIRKLFKATDTANQARGKEGKEGRKETTAIDRRRRIALQPARGEKTALTAWCCRTAASSFEKRRGERGFAVVFFIVLSFPFCVPKSSIIPSLVGLMFVRPCFCAFLLIYSYLSFSHPEKTNSALEAWVRGE